MKYEMYISSYVIALERGISRHRTSDSKCLQIKLVPRVSFVWKVIVEIIAQIAKLNMNMLLSTFSCQYPYYNDSTLTFFLVIIVKLCQIIKRKFQFFVRV